MNMRGIYLPIITPMIGDKIDYTSYKALVSYYLDSGIAGLIPLGTTGEAPTIETYEVEKLIDITLETVKGKLPVYFGHSSNNTNHVIQNLKIYENKGLQGILSASPYYNRPSQEGIYEHFKSIAQSTDLDMILYNIPYRTGSNMENHTIHRLAEVPNIVALKDACANITQTTELLLDRPKDLSILTGEDYQFLCTMALGGDGGILASAHLNTSAYVTMYEAVKNNDLNRAQFIWNKIAPAIPYLFKEPNPAPLKFILKELGFISSDQLRLPMMSVTDAYKEVLKSKLDLKHMILMNH